MDQRLEFILLARQEGVNMSRLCKRFCISRTTAYKWLRRFGDQGPCGLVDQSRRPHDSPRRTRPDVEATVLALRDRHPAWGGRKIRRRLLDLRKAGQWTSLDGLTIPSAGTITAILHRHNRIEPEVSQESKAHQRFEYAHPNDLWQMDFKGDVALTDRRVSHPLTVLDDHSRFNVCLQSCLRQTGETVQECLTDSFRRYGLPRAILADNGSPWGGGASNLTRLALWLLRLGIRVMHGRPWHPQTQGKEERFHKTLKAEVLTGRVFADSQSLQKALNAWRPVYNHQRPHEALDMNTPGSRYRISPRTFPEELPPIEYDAGDVTRCISINGASITFQGRWIQVSRGLQGERVAVRPTTREGVYRICYGSFAIGEFSLEEIPRGSHGRARIFASARSAHLGEYPCEELLAEE